MIFLGAIAFSSTPSFADLGQLSLGIIAGPYKPNIDGSTKLNPDGTLKSAGTIYRDAYGDKWLPLVGLEADIHLMDYFGSLRLGLAAQYTYAGGIGFESSDPRIPTASAMSSSGLHLLHLKPIFTYVFDPYIDTVPLAPYIRGGVVAAGYYFTHRDKTIYNGFQPAGVLFGWEAAAGLMLCLDWIEPDVAQRARGDDVYEHTFLKAEIAYMPIDNFGAPGLNLSPVFWGTTAPLMLTFGLVIEF
jgi:hypothetical protein